MSLILTTNTSSNDGVGALNTGINRPFDYINFTTDTFEIEANSEVAVQSIKFNKEGNVEVNKMNNQFYVNCGSKEEINAAQTTSLAVHTILGNKDVKFQVYNAVSLADVIKDAINNGLCHPDLVPSDGPTVSGTAVTVARDSANKFVGYQIVMNGLKYADLSDKKDKMAFVDSLKYADVNGSWNTANHRITKIAGKECEMIGSGGPISQCDGSMELEFHNAGTGWEIGLTRYLDEDVADHVEQNFGWYHPRGESYYDYVVKSQLQAPTGKYFLRVYHAVMDGTQAGDFDGQNDLILEEIAYPDPQIEVFATPAEYTALIPRKVLFNIQNEKVSLSVIDNNIAPTTRALFTGTNASKLLNLKPTSTNTKYLYPKVRVRTDTAFLTVLQAELSIPKGFLYGGNMGGAAISAGTLALGTQYYDYFNMATYGTTTFAKALDQREMFNYVKEKDTPYIQLGLNADKGLFTSGTGDNSWGISLILSEEESDNPFDEDESAFWPSYGANATAILGFQDDPVIILPTSETTTSETYTSINIPQQISTNSIFIRLNNFLQRTINGQTNGISKIIYHVPRFDNGGNEFGGLFFEPSERVYIKLNNTDKLRRNEISVSLVNSDETLAENITGKTIVMFHIRKSQS